MKDIYEARNAEAKKNTQDAINKIIEGKTIETYVIAGFALVVLVVVFIALF